MDQDRPLITTEMEIIEEPQNQTVEHQPDTGQHDVQKNNGGVGEQHRHYRVYPERWYILGMYGICGIWQNLVYGTFAPIAQSSTIALQLTQTDIALLPNWFNIAYVLTAFPFVYLVEVKGLRMPMTATMGFCAMGATLRYLHTGNKDFDKIFLHLGQLANGLGSAVPWFACTTISAVWFPPHERNVSTAIGLFTSNLGVAIAFLIGPGFINIYKGSGTPQEVCDAIYNLFYLEGIISMVLLFFTAFYYPSKPPTPPSFSASTGRVSYVKGFLDFAANPWAWIMFIVYTLSTFNQTWNQFIVLIVKDIMDETEVSWLGFAMTTVPIFLGPCLAAILAVPCLKPYSRHVSIGMVVIATAAAALFTVAANIESQKYLLTKELVWLTVVSALTLSTAAQPIWWEMACDACYPVPESIVSGIFSVGSCSLSLVFLVILMVPQLGYMWINWVFLACLATTIPLLCIYKHRGRRTAADDAGQIITDGDDVGIINNSNRFDYNNSAVA